MELILNNGFNELSIDNTYDIVGGGTALAVLGGALTVVTTAALVYLAPPGTKVKTGAKVLAEGIFLTAALYEM